ncbi:MAG: hypothetical protein PWQ20_1187 [Thermotogaceae bacterium]|jgi:tetratricopeptide (TPR) repeat protein|nr:hypothetical protein [Thermotogaceae bacterium]MDN5338117.1 hypothetical protein [Thermotogaceae bacterium]
MKKIIFLLFIIIFSIFQTSSFSQNFQEKGMQLYIAGMDAFQNGEYKKAQELLEQALTIYPDIESKAKNIKLILGIASFYNGQYEKSKTYLELFKENPIAQELLSKIPENIDEKSIEDMSFLNTSQTSTDVQSKTVNQNLSMSTETSNSSNAVLKLFFIGLIAFLVPFLSLIFIELRFKILSRSVENLVNLFKKPSKEIENNKDADIGTAQTMTDDSSVQIFNNIDIEEYSKKDIEDTEKLLKEVENMGKPDIKEYIVETAEENHDETEVSSEPEPREAILSVFQNNVETDLRGSEESTEESTFYFYDYSQIKTKAEKLIKELGNSSQNSEWKSMEDLPEELTDKIKELENKEEYNKEDIEKILEYTLHEFSKGESG